MHRTVTAALAAILAAAAIAAAALPADARPAVNWQQRTCTAFSAWDRHRTPARLAALVTGSTHLGRSWLKADAGSLYADASSPSPKAAKYLAEDASYVSQDCGG